MLQSRSVGMRMNRVKGQRLGETHESRYDDEIDDGKYYRNEDRLPSRLDEVSRTNQVDIERYTLSDIKIFL